MKIALINASPKIKNSNSELILSDLKHYLNNKCEIIEANLSFNADFDSIYTQIKNTDSWLFAYPLYVDNMPSHLMKFLEWLSDNQLCTNKRNIYAICNCGFYEGVQAECAINVVKFWCNKTSNIFGGGVGIGGGEAFDAIKSIPVGFGPKASIDKALCTLAEAIVNKTATDSKYVNLNYPRFLYKLGATGRWHKEIRQNGGKVKDLGRQLT